MLGVDANKLADIIGSDIEKEFVVDMNDAVNSANKFADSGDLILLAPACSSLDMYINY